MSGLYRFFVDKIEDITEISGEEFLHAVNVLRVKQGQRILLLNNTDTEYEAEVLSIDKKSLTCKVIKTHKNDRESAHKILLICGFLKGDKTELVVQKAVELGLAEIVVFESRYTQNYLSENKVNRLNKVSKEAAKQCGRSKYPLIRYEKELNCALAYGKDYKNKLFACEFSDDSQVDLKSVYGDTAIVIGSEGGFTEGELKAALDLGYNYITLGNRILRAETAAITMCGIIAFLNGDLNK